MVTEKAGGYISRLELTLANHSTLNKTILLCLLVLITQVKVNLSKIFILYHQKKYQLLLSLILRLLKVKNHFCLYYRAFQAEMIKAHTRIILFLGMVSIIGKNLPIVHF